MGGSEVWLKLYGDCRAVFVEDRDSLTPLYKRAESYTSTQNKFLRSLLLVFA